MTIRIAKILGLETILDLSKRLDIYDDIPELLSVSLGRRNNVAQLNSVMLRLSMVGRK